MLLRNDHRAEIVKRFPSWEGKGRQALRWVVQSGNPPRRSATAWSLLKTPPSRHPSREGIS